MPEQTTGGKISFWGIIVIIVFSGLVWYMISHDHQKPLYLIMTFVISAFLLMIAFDLGLAPRDANNPVRATAMGPTLSEPARVSIPSAPEIPSVAKKSPKKSSSKRR